MKRMELNYDCLGLIIEHIQVATLLKWKYVSKKIREMVIDEINRREHMMTIKHDKAHKLNKVAKIYKHLNLSAKYISRYNYELLDTTDWYKYENLSTVKSVNMDHGVFDGNLFPSLINLSISNSDIKNLSNLTNLKMLEASEMYMDNIKLSELSQLTNLTSLYAWDAEITLPSIQNLTKLEYLYLERNGGEYISVISKLINLKTLYLSDVSFLTPNIISNFTKLEDLSLKTCVLFDGVITEIASLPKLKRFQYTPISYDNSYAHEIKLLTHVENLDFMGFWNLDDDTLIHLLTNGVTKNINICHSIVLTKAILPYLHNTKVKLPHQLLFY